MSDAITAVYKLFTAVQPVPVGLDRANREANNQEKLRCLAEFRVDPHRTFVLAQSPIQIWEDTTEGKVHQQAVTSFLEYAVAKFPAASFEENETVLSLPIPQITEDYLRTLPIGCVPMVLVKNLIQTDKIFFVTGLLDSFSQKHRSGLLSDDSTTVAETIEQQISEWLTIISNTGKGNSFAEMLHITQLFQADLMASIENFSVQAIATALGYADVVQLGLAEFKDVRKRCRDVLRVRGGINGLVDAVRDELFGVNDLDDFDAFDPQTGRMPNRFLKVTVKEFNQLADHLTEEYLTGTNRYNDHAAVGMINNIEVRLDPTKHAPEGVEQIVLSAFDESA